MKCMTMLLVVAVMGCAVGRPTRPPEPDIASAWTFIDGIKPGDGPDAIKARFPNVPPDNWDFVGLLDGSSFQDASGKSYTFSIGYYYYAGNIGYHGIVDKKVMAVVTFANGMVQSIYRP